MSGLHVRPWGWPEGECQAGRREDTAAGKLSKVKLASADPLRHASSPARP